MERIALGNHEFEGRNNAYLLQGDGEVALVDTGIATPATRKELELKLADHGVAVEDLDHILLTHWHPDHTGLAGELQAASGATVSVHEADAPIVERNPDVLADFRDRQLRRFDEWGMPASARAELEAVLDESESKAGEPVTVERLADGDRLTAAGTEFEVLHTAGHTAGLCCFEFETDGRREAFVGDVVLPVYTPNVGGADVRVERALATYLDSLRRLEQRAYDRLWPGHRDVIESPGTRIQTIIDHHRHRTERVIDVLDAHGPADAWTVSAQLFGDLEGIHIMHGPGEADAHLDHLRHHGVVDRTDEGYQLVADAVPRIAELV